MAALSLAVPSGAAGLKDAESASHGDEAANYQLIKTYEYPGFRVLQFNLAVLSHYSYMLLSGKEALVVDPGRDIDAYLETAKKEGVTITGVFLTHSHADFVAGHMEMAKVMGCPIYISAAARAGYKHDALREGSTVKVGDATVKFLETPGHTLDVMCGMVYGTADPAKPLVMFTGDVIFVGSVGRPDLLEGTIAAADLAAHSFDTWTNKLSRLNDDLVILPAHGAGSLCGAHLRDEPSSTLGQERATNPYLRQKSRSAFIASILEGLPEAPQYFKHNAAVNRKGPEPVDWKAPLRELAPEAVLTDIARYYVVDIRNAKAYAAGHIPNSVNIALRGRFETWVGIMVPWGSHLVLCGNPADLREAVRRLHRVGYTAEVVGFEAWKKAGLPLKRNDTVEPRALYDLMQKGDAPLIVDVRLPNEWMGLRIGTVINMPLSHLAELASKLNPGEHVVTVCNSAYRSSMAVGILERKGFRKVSSLAGGSEAWTEAGLPVYEAAKGGGAPGPKKVVRLADRIAPAGLKRLIVDLPGTFDLVDIRPPEYFNDFRLPASRNADVAELLENPAYLAGAGPLIIVDRDGSLAMQVAGILSQKTERRIMALHGGLEAYWRESQLGAVAAPPAGAPGMRWAPGATPRPPAAPAAVPPAGPKPEPAKPPAPGTAPKPPKKKSAGC
jgi:rhodanese-related sulfurtransferase/glyoxylase-like metal-dependent hydrolase (beta-lactamase superfamily II)